MPGAEFLDLPARAPKPRGRGITGVLDRGLSLGQSAALLEAGGAYVDVWKFGWGISYVDPSLLAKLELLDRHRVLACPGGTLLEIAWAQGRAAAFFGWARACGFPCVEVSAGTVPMTAGDKRDLIAEAARHFIVLAEVGPKDPGARMLPEQWAAAVVHDLDAGATWVLAEGRASGSVGLYAQSGAVREEIVDALAGAPDPGVIVFEAPREGQQAWFVRRFGPDVNLANVAPGDALGLETLRLGLRADTAAAAVPGALAAHRT
jgi:phosphosulfolactate synthase